MSTVRWNRFVAAAVDGLEWPTSTCQTQLRSVPVDSDCTIRMEWGHVGDQWHQEVAVCLSASHRTASPTPRPVDEFMATRKVHLMLFGGEVVNSNGNYVDGISITSGSSRKHLWAYVAGHQENFIHSSGQYECPCSTGSTQHPHFSCWSWLFLRVWCSWSLQLAHSTLMIDCGMVSSVEW